MELIFVTQNVWNDIKPLVSKLSAAAKQQGLTFRVLTDRDTYATKWSAIRDAEYCVVWHGLTPISSWAREIRQCRGMHCVVAECGWFPQSAHWAFDKEGFCGLSVLNGDLPRADPAFLMEVREEYQQRLKREPGVPMVKDAVLVPLQLPRDSAVFAHAPYPRMDMFVSHVLETFPDRPIVFKSHPKALDWPVDAQGRGDVLVARGGWFPSLAVEASLVYGQTSNALYEAALMRVPVEAIGNCPLHHHKHNQERLLQVMAAKQVSRNATPETFWEAIQ